MPSGEYLDDMAPASIELVVARYTESLNWLRRVPPGVRVVVYDKNPDAAHAGVGQPAAAPPVEAQPVAARFDTVRLPNVGREAHTYLWHLVQRYHTLARLTVFCQGRPFDHAFNFHRTLRRLAENANAAPDFEPLGHIVDTDDAAGRLLFIRWSKNEDGRMLDMNGFHRALLGENGPSEYTFRPGAQFAASAACLRRRPCDFYERALHLAVAFPDAAHCFERAWSRVFGVENPDARWLNGRKTAYLKPIRRLQADATPLP